MVSSYLVIPVIIQLIAYVSIIALKWLISKSKETLIEGCVSLYIHNEL